jgi:tetratricopeptide (TPR) repeat protein
LSPAADSLIKKAEQERQAGDYVGAAATLERALGIQPQEPYIWNRLARVRMEQGLYAQAGTLALRSNALAGDQAVLKQDNWRMIAAARRAVGDTAGAAEAERKAQGG